MAKTEAKPEYEWPYFISFAETDQIKEYDTVRPILKQFKKLDGKPKVECFNEISKELEALPGEFNFDRSMLTAHAAINMTDDQLVEAAGPAKVEFEREFGALEAVFHSGVADIHWFDLQIKRADLSLAYSIYELEGKRRGMKADDLTKAVKAELDNMSATKQVLEKAAGVKA